MRRGVEARHVLGMSRDNFNIRVISGQSERSDYRNFGLYSEAPSDRYDSTIYRALIQCRAADVYVCWFLTERRPSLLEESCH